MRTEFYFYCKDCKEVYHFGNLAPSVCFDRTIIVRQSLISNLQVFIELGRKLQVNTIYPPLDNLQKLVDFCRRHKHVEGHPGHCKVVRDPGSLDCPFVEERGVVKKGWTIWNEDPILKGQ